MSTEKVVIIIPTFNEALVIEETIAQVFKAAAPIPEKTIHLLIFDSNSTDQTQTIVNRLMQTYDKLHLKTEPEKSGLGAAYLQAMHYALTDLSADVVVEFDADLSHQPKYLAPMLERLKTHEVVVGSRYVPGGSIPRDWGRDRQFLSVLGNYVARFMLTPKYKDFTSGFRATRQAALTKALPKQFLTNHYAYKLELLWKLHKNGAKICEHPIQFIDRQKGQSKLPTNSILDSMRVLFHLRFQELKPYLNMCLIGLSGMIIQCLVYNLLRQSLPPFNAAQLAVIVAMMNNFTLNNRFTFRKRLLVERAQKLKSFALFIGYSLFMIGFQGYWLQLGIKYLGTGYLKENGIIIAGIIIGSILNYRTYSRWVWPKKNLQALQDS